VSKVWLVSDLHLGHKSICKYRPEFRFPEEHNHTIAENLFQPLGKRDTIYLLGDICFSKDWAWIYKKLADEVASVHLVIGNHDSENAQRQSILKEAINAGVRLHSLVSYKGCWLSHAPLHPEELRGKYCIHGHMHRQLLPDTRYANVCVEHTNWAPILFTDVKEKLEKANQHESNL
jgi:calcineurin-like phosphoesterase family protein